MYNITHQPEKPIKDYHIDTMRGVNLVTLLGTVTNGPQVMKIPKITKGKTIKQATILEGNNVYEIVVFTMATNYIRLKRSVKEVEYYDHHRITVMLPSLVEQAKSIKER